MAKDNAKTELFKKYDKDSSMSYEHVKASKQWIRGLRDGHPAISAELRKYEKH
ncbi:hypothetical protein ABZ388_06635 [Micromonospora parva]|uniref:hypothetical protein n=1 Tax=Micromonospora parva TaxID=1464048 RepID=UPI0033DAEFA1